MCQLDTCNEEAEKTEKVPLAEFDGMLEEVLYFLMREENRRITEVEQSKHERNKSELTDSVSDNDAGTSIVELELSIRSYNCLMRAGITTIEKLQTLQDEDFYKIRNLGRKCLEEIKEKLGKYKKNSNRARRIEKTGPNYLSMLDELIGLNEVKQQVRKIVAFAKMKRHMKENGEKSVPVVLNMGFIGNPGTAKTTVARIMAGILYEAELLSSDELIEVGRSDLVGKYVGQTAGKVKKVFQMAKGKLLFIDEAYSLVECWEDSYGDEAIDTIVQEMENARDETVVIFAGYPKEMDEFFSRNPGLRSRVPFSIRFHDYSAEDLARIAELEAEHRGFCLMPQAKERMRSICETANSGPDNGNGRFCRNMIDEAIMNYALRVYGSENSLPNEQHILAPEDFLSPKLHQEKKESFPIGFRI